MPVYSADVLRSRIAELERRLHEILRAHGEAGERSSARRSEAEDDFKKAEAHCRAEHQARRRELAAPPGGEGSPAENLLAHDLARIERAFSNDSSRIDEMSSAEEARLKEEKRKALEKAVGELREACGRVLVRNSAEVSEIGGLFERTQKLKDRVSVLASGLGIKAAERPPASKPTASEASERVIDAAKEGLEAVEKDLDERLREGRLRLARSGPGLLSLVAGIVLAHAAGLLAVRELKPELFRDALWVAPVSFLLLFSAASAFRSWVRGRAHSIVDPLQARVLEIQVLLHHREAALKRGEKLAKEGFFRKKTARVEEIEERFQPLDKQARKVRATRKDILEGRRDELAERARLYKDRRIVREAERREREKKALDVWLDEEVRRLKAEHKGRMEGTVREERAEKEGLAGRWEEAIRDFRRAAEEARRESRGRHPSWSDPRWRSLEMAGVFPDGVYLGEVRLDLKILLGASDYQLPFPCPEEGGLSFPLELSFPEQASLLLGADPERRDRALRGLFNLVLRVLCAFPPGKAKFVIFDPVGLGQNFSALMHLADYEESLVGGRIWTEMVHIERKLAEMTEHIEKVIQKYLRNRYDSIAEYNREVAQMAEAYRFLVVADFPTGFSDLAKERLASIVTSGARCGVHTLILRDQRQKLTAPLDEAAFKGQGAGLTIQAVDGGFAVEDDVLARGVLDFEEPPPPEALTTLLNDVGRQCVDASRVELSFETVAPKEDRLWGESSEAGIRIPLGRAGADRLQYLDLGRGTAQHALVAGKTGSGKSTLFHVMVTNAALWYSPRELEVYLIDFKKGVEFKTYAVNGLPHARVVAIESDREFGLSVLRRIDRELTVRAELFRKEGVQDFAGCRKAAGADRLPRTLLMIDEFQEFFVEEDAIAQEAALLLDRIVRQGRAFGIHVVLGSQTLGGSYTLARATLGQMAVRIALQCNEADSYLILNDENSAARLLSRPGEAIYNDMSGMVEGNNPFQVAWLPDEVRERFLRRVGAKAEREKARPPEPMAVFEGNVPADLRNNLLLKERLAHPFRVAAEGDVSAWIGEANAIKGPTEVRFGSHGSSNLVIVGQQRESALSVITSTVVGLAAACPAEGLRFVVLDGSPPELAQSGFFDRLAETIPNKVDRVEYARVPRVMEDLGAEVRGRLEGSRRADQRIFLVIYDLQRFRQIRQKSEYEFSSGGEEKPSPDRCFADVLTEGPAQKVHAIVWSDSLNNLNRAFNRKTLREFQMRILFQMSAADSSEIIDSPLAGTLGLHRGLLFLEEHGTVEKFRPYALPDAGVMEEVRKALRDASPRGKRRGPLARAPRWS